jgi:hypothetical protein
VIIAKDETYGGNTQHAPKIEQDRAHRLAKAKR